MKALILTLLALALANACFGRIVYQQQASSGYESSSSSSVSSSFGHGSYMQTCCELNSWALGHMGEIHQMANRLRMEYNSKSQGKDSISYSVPWNAEIIQHTGKTASELNALSSQLVNQVVADLQQGLTRYTTIAQPNFFVWKAAQLLETLERDSVETQQQQQILVPDIFGPVGTSEKKTIVKWVEKHMEPSVVDYQTVVNVEKWSGTAQTYQPPVHIPVDLTPLENPHYTAASSIVTIPPTYLPASTVTFRQYNKSSFTDASGTKTHGTEVKRKWINGELVVDINHPFGGNTQVPRDEAWKQEERERLFWLLTGNIASQTLEAWQRQQEERLVGLAERYHLTLEDIHQWHNKEYQRFLALQSQYHDDDKTSSWKQTERPRLDWLIHQNSLTREGLEHWQNENNFKLQQLARMYRIPPQEFINWQHEELNRIHTIFNTQNHSMSPNPTIQSIHKEEQQRLHELIREHNATIEMLQSSIAMDKERLLNLSTKYQDNVQRLELWLQNELTNIHDLISKQNNKMSNMASWQSEERDRLENILHLHRGSVRELEERMHSDHQYLETLAAKYNVSIGELEKWQQNEMERFLKEGREQMTTELKEWQKMQKERLKSMLSELTVDEFRQQILSDRSRLQDLANSFRIGVADVEKWIMQQIESLKSRGLFKEVKAELEQWQQQERNRLLAIVGKHDLTVKELREKIYKDQSYLYAIAAANEVRVDEILEWVKKETERLISEGLVKADELKAWQKEARDDLERIVRGNYLTVEEFENRLLAEQQRLQQIAITHNVELSELDDWIKKEIERLQKEGYIEMENKLKNWKQLEFDRLREIADRTKLSMSELLDRLNKDQNYLQTMAHQYNLQITDIRTWLEKQIEEEKRNGNLQMENLKKWQEEWVTRVMNMLNQRDYTIREFHVWLMEERVQLENLAKQNNVRIEEIDQWIKTEEERLLSMNILKSNPEKLTNWQRVESNYLENIAQEKYETFEQLEERLRKVRELLGGIAAEYKVQVAEASEWMDKELQRLLDSGKLQIKNLTAWQVAEHNRLEEMLRANSQWTAEELEAELLKDRKILEETAFKHHTTVEQIEKWLEGEVIRLRENGKLNIEKHTAWQQAELRRILELLDAHAHITAEEFEAQLKQDRNFLLQLARQYHVDIKDLEDYAKKVVDDLRKKGEFEVENLKAWQLAERDYIKQLIAQYKDSYSTAELEEMFRNDRAHLHQLADQYRVSVQEIEAWMSSELKRLLQDSGKPLQKLADWQVAEVQRIKDLIRANHHLNYVEFEEHLIKNRGRLQELASTYSLTVEEIETFLRQQLLNLRISHAAKVDDLAKWQEDTQTILIEKLLGEQMDFSPDNLEIELQRDHARLQKLAQQYGVSVTQIETWMRDELQRLKDSGLFEIQLLAWQRAERARIQDWLITTNNHATIQEFNDFIKRDKEHIHLLAQQYQITVKEVEDWLQIEAARLRILGQITFLSHGNIRYPENIWQNHTRALLEAIVRVKHMSWPEFEEYLVQQRMRWEQIARQNNLSVEEVEQWLRLVAQDLVNRGLIQGPKTVEGWQAKEQLYIQNLIDEKMRKQQQWSIEELERWLHRDRPLRVIALQYRLPVEVIETWLKQTLQHLLDQGKIVSEHLVDWQRREKDRIYWIVTHNSKMTKDQLESILLDNTKSLQLLSNEYRVNTQELEFWICTEVDRLVDLGLVYADEVKDQNDWRRQEANRLRNIAAEIRITEEEFLEFIANDLRDQEQLARTYGVPLETLAPLQRIEIGVLRREGLLDAQKLLSMEKWKMLKRSRILQYLKRPNINLEQLLELDHQIGNDQDLVSQFGVSQVEVNYWKITEFTRLQELAKSHGMSLNQLAEFYENEKLYIDYVMHKMTSTEELRISWGAKEADRMAELERISGLSGDRLLAWRRKLYLLCEGRLPNGDRGDQPPTGEDLVEVDCDEPQIAANEDVWQQQVQSEDSLYELAPARRVVSSQLSTMSTYSQQHVQHQRVTAG